MESILILPFVLGIISVIQAGLNEKIFPNLGVTLTVVLNSATLMLTSVIVWYLLRATANKTPSQLLDSSGSGDWSWWFIIPGILGYMLVGGIPLAIHKIGASTTFLILVLTQIAAGLAWECIDEHRLPNHNELLGCSFAVAAAFFTKRTVN